MIKIPIKEILKSLSIKRPVFHSEADFQFALAWEIKEQFPEAEIRLEIPFGENKKEYLDILVKLGNQLIPIELKYKTKKTDLIHNGEPFSLKKHGAYNWGRYDFLKDVERVEKFVEASKSSQGYTIVLSNDSNYWKENSKNTLDKEFSVQEGRVIEGTLSWQDGMGTKTIKHRKAPIQLRNRYSSKWIDYSNLENNAFRVVIFSASV